MGNMIITVSRQYGSGGKTIAAMLAQKLGINCYSREILKIASEDSGINERLFGMSDEKLRHAGWLKTLSHTYTGELLLKIRALLPMTTFLIIRPKPSRNLPKRNPASL